jgi:hypothetical protein
MLYTPELSARLAVSIGILRNLTEFFSASVALCLACQENRKPWVLGEREGSGRAAKLIYTLILSPRDGQKKLSEVCVSSERDGALLFG